MLEAIINAQDITGVKETDLALQDAKKELWLRQQIANLIKIGKSSKKITEILKISLRSVYFHRNNIRKKLRPQNAKKNLQTYLTSIA